MRTIKILNRLLWGMNGLAGLGIVAFAWFFLVSPREAGFPKNYPWDDRATQLPSEPPTGSDAILKSLRNPLDDGVKCSPNSPPVFRAELRGTIASADPTRCAAFLKATARNTDLIAYVGEEIKEGGKPFEDLRGWKMVDTTKNTATFSDGAKTHRLIVAATPGSSSRLPGAPNSAIPQDLQPAEARPTAEGVVR